MRFAYFIALHEFTFAFAGMDNHVVQVSLLELSHALGAASCVV